MKPENSLVSIIVPNYNHSAFLVERLRSISNQSYQNFELILLDDASSDNSREVLQAYAKNESRVSHVKFNQSNTGVPFKQWLKGLSLARGDYIWIAESDDCCHPNFLETLVPLLQRDPHTAIAYCGSLKIDTESQVLGKFELMSPEFKKNIWEKDFVVEGSDLIEPFMAFRNIIPNASSALFKRSLIEKVAFNYSHLLRRIQDWMLYIDLMAEHRVAYSAKSHNYCRIHSQSVTRSHSPQSYRETVKERLKVLKKIKAIGGSHEHYRNALKSLVRYRNKYQWAENIRITIDAIQDSEVKVALYGFNELSKYIIENQQSKRVSLVIDKNCSSDNFHHIPICKIDDVNLQNVDLVAICSIAHKAQMQSELQRVKYLNYIIDINSTKCLHSSNRESKK